MSNVINVCMSKFTIFYKLNMHPRLCRLRTFHLLASANVKQSLPIGLGMPLQVLMFWLHQKPIVMEFELFTVWVLERMLTFFFSFLHCFHVLNGVLCFHVTENLDQLHLKN